jgi:hypothetical protein
VKNTMAGLLYIELGLVYDFFSSASSSLQRGMNWSNLVKDACSKIGMTQRSGLSVRL